MLVEHGSGTPEVRATAPFNEVAKEGPGGTGKAKEGMVGGGLPKLCDSGIDVVQFIRDILPIQGGSILGATDGTLDFGTISGHKLETCANGVGDHQDVREDNGGVQVEAPEGLEGGFGTQCGGPDQFKKGTVATQFAVFGQKAARLSHQPDGIVVGVLALEGGEGTLASSHGALLSHERAGRCHH